MTVLVDTNVLLRARHPGGPHHDECVRAVEHLRRRSHVPAVCAQVLIEYWVVATRPVDVNGFGLSVADAVQDLRYICNSLSCLPEPPDIARRWRDIAEQYGVQGLKAHDARLVALMQAHNITRLVTLDPDDFSRYEGISVLTPASILSR